MLRLKKSIEYPNNLIAAIFALKYDELEWLKQVNDDMINGLLFAMENLMDREREILVLRYKEFKTYEEIGAIVGVTRGRVRDIIARSLRKLRHPSYSKYINYGLDFVAQSEKVENERIARIELAKQNDFGSILLQDLKGISVSTFLALRKLKIHTVGELVRFRNENIKDWHLRIPNFDIKGLREVEDILRWKEIEDKGHEDIPLKNVEGLRMCTYNALRRKGVNTIGDILTLKREHGAAWYTLIPNIGVKSAQEVEIMLSKYAKR